MSRLAVRSEARAALRFEVLETSSEADVHGESRVAAIVPTERVGVFIAGREDVGPRVTYVSAPCPLRLSWVN